MVTRKKLAANLGCPLGGVGVGTAAADPPGLVGGGVNEAGGRGGSATSFSVRTGFGASAGGR